MSSVADTPSNLLLPDRASALVNKSLARRHAAEKRFKLYGLLAICLGLSFVAFLFVDIIGKGYPAFTQTQIRLDVTLSAEELFGEPVENPSRLSQEELGRANYNAVVRDAISAEFPGVEGRRERRNLYGLVSSGAAFQLRDMVMDDPSLIGTQQSVWVLADDDVDTFRKGFIDRDIPENLRPFSDQQIAWVDQLVTDGDIRTTFNTTLFTNGDSRDPELAGIRGAVMGSALTLTITLLLSFPMGVATAVYLEEFAPRNHWTDLIEVNINNLAAVPSIVFGLLGLAVFLNFFGLPRSAPLVGGLVLTLMTLPTIIISSRASLKSVPPSIREAALGMGASKMQMISHHVLPLAMPGMLTGAIIGMAQALGETAPLLMIGMIAFIVDVPSGFTDSATVLPVQIYLWSDLPERAFVARTSATIMVLLAFLIVMNATAVILRKRFERRW